MDWQTLFNFAGSAVLAAVGWWCRQIWDSVQALKEDVKKIEIDLPTNYVKKDEIKDRFDRIEALFDKLYEKIDSKVDK